MAISVCVVVISQVFDPGKMPILSSQTGEDSLNGVW